MTHWQLDLGRLVIMGRVAARWAARGSPGPRLTMKFNAACRRLAGLDLPAIGRTTLPAWTNSLELNMHRYSVPTMTCGHCAGRIVKAVASVDPQAAVSVDVAIKQVTVRSQVEEGRLIEAIQAAGYEPRRFFL
jgi:copper chaperone